MEESKRNEFLATQLSELPEGAMKAVEHDGLRILLSNIGGQVYAVGGSCPHYGAPLEKGVLSDKRIVCPWHHAAFDARSGDLLEPPALDCLPTFEVRVENDNVYVSLPEDATQTRTATMVGPEAAHDDRTFVVLGGGAAGNAAVQALREKGFRGRLVLVTQESHLPYDRPNLSKEYLKGKADPEWMPLRPSEFFDGAGIEVWLGARVETAELPSRLLRFEDGRTLSYDRLLLATGGTPRRLPISGSDLDRVFTLRSFDDADAVIAAASNARRAVIIGASFIGLETASCLRSRGLEVTVVAPDEVPFERVFGREIGERFRRAHEEEGTKFRLGATVERFEGNGTVAAAVLGDGEHLPADFVVLGVGVRPATEFIRGLQLAPDGAVVVDEYFQAFDNVYAAGDIAQFPDWRTGERQRIEHWRTAEQQGRQAAFNMADRHVPFTGVPFFWTRQAGLSLGYVGHAIEWDDMIVHGSIGDHDFVAFYIKNDTVAAAVSMKRGRQLNAAHELLRRGKMPLAMDLRKREVDLTALL